MRSHGHLTTRRLSLEYPREWGSHGMPSLNLTAASRAAGVGRSTIVRALKSGRLSATANEQGERVIDASELSRVFGPLKGDGYPSEQAANSHDMGHDDGVTTLLREQLRKAEEREARLLALLEAEQQARRDLETKLLPSPAPQPTARPSRTWLPLLALLLSALAFAAWRWLDVIISLLNR